jgi:signal transduction histidine kinase
MGRTTLKMHPRASGILGTIEQAFDSLPAALAVAGPSRERAHALATAGADAGEAMAGLCFAVELLRSLPAQAADHLVAVRDLIAELEVATSVPRVVLGRFVLAGPLDAGGHGEPLAQTAALERTLALLAAFTGAEALSLWSTAHGTAAPVVRVGGRLVDEAAVVAGAGAVLADGGPLEYAEAEILALRLVAGENRTPIALVAAGEFGSPSEALLLFATAGPGLAAVIEGSSEERRAGAAAQRQLARLRFDLHDGPQQDVLLLAEDLRMFQDQLESVLAEHPLRARIIGRLDDLKARLVALDGDLRRISSLLESPFLPARSFPEALGALADAFANRTSILPQITLTGEFAGLSDSQQITLLGLIREALSNIREHSNSENVSISVVSDTGGVAAEVTDDGDGFDPEKELVRAAREGHLGLVGMHERVRLLGGSTRIDSRPGGPTVISVTLPARPAAGERPNFTAY